MFGLIYNAEASDKDEIILTTDHWLIVKRCDRGYLPYYTLHRKKTMFSYTWWSGMKKWSEDYDRLKDFVVRWENWEEQVGGY